LFSPPRFATSQDRAAREAVKAAEQALVAKKLDLLDAHLAGKDHVLGRRRTFLDAYVLPILCWARAMLPDSLLVHPNCQRLLLHVAADSVAKKLMSYEGIG
jgi:glutathione S-transferase